jgi:two-component system response regulator
MSDGVILLVEDNPDDEALTLRALKRHKILNEVVVARDGAEAIEYLLPGEDTGRTLPDLVLLDLKLPKVDGLEVLRQIRTDERTMFIPVVVLTSSKEQEDILASYRLHVNAYVRKPIRFDEFTSAISTLGVFWLLLNEHVTTT